MSACFAIKGTNRIRRAAVSGTEYLRTRAGEKNEHDLGSIERQGFVEAAIE